jgi:hypothetical protein
MASLTAKYISMSVKKYQKEIKRKFGSFDAVWPPNTPLELGQVIKVKKRRVRADTYGSLRSRGISFEEKASATGTDYKFKSENEVTRTFKLGGSSDGVTEYLVKADAGIVLQFEKEFSALLELTDTTTRTIDNLDVVQHAVAELDDNDKWDDDYLIVSQVIEAEHATILVSGSRDSKVEINLGSAIEPADVELAKIETKFLKETSGQMQIRVGDISKATPLFRVVRLKRNKLKPEQATIAPINEYELEEVDLDKEADKEELTEAFRTSQDTP